jgi:quinone-modifying oxidoreductase subunit QmoC
MEMAQMQRIEPDVEFVKELQSVGGDTLKKCYQCATCSVACPISPADNPFPRKEMVWAQWGMKDQLVNDIDIWLCHRCNTCSDLCPRGAKPGDLLAAMRSMVYRNLVEPKFIGEWLSSPKHLPKLIAIPAVIYFIIWAIRAMQLGSVFPKFVDVDHKWKVAEEGGKVIYGGLFPGDYTIDPVFSLVALFVTATFVLGVSKLIKSLSAQKFTYYVGGRETPTLIQSLKAVIVDEIFPHSKWKSCGDNDEATEERFKGHLVLFWSFAALLVVTTIIAVAHWGPVFLPFLSFLDVFGHTPLNLLNPVKILANLGAVGMIIGLVYLTRRRLNQDESKSKSSYYDWYLLGVIWAVGLTGIFCQLLRLADVAVLAYPMYYIHLISIFLLIAYLPWSKFGHMVYRTAALVYAYKVGRVPLKQPEDNTYYL